MRFAFQPFLDVRGFLQYLPQFSLFLLIFLSFLLIFPYFAPISLLLSLSLPFPCFEWFHFGAAAPRIIRMLIAYINLVPLLNDHFFRWYLLSFRYIKFVVGADFGVNHNKTLIHTYISIALMIVWHFVYKYIHKIKHFFLKFMFTSWFFFIFSSSLIFSIQIYSNLFVMK